MTRKERRPSRQTLPGEGFVLDMFKTELANHEYGYTYELDETLAAVGLTISAVKANQNLLNGLRKALEKYGVTI